MTTNVRTSAKPVRTALGGSAEAPIAERTSESTTTMRTKEVHITSTSGTRESIVRLTSKSSGCAPCRLAEPKNASRFTAKIEM